MGEKEQGFESVHPAEISIQKILHDGNLYLMYKGTMYDVMGRELKN